MHTISRSDDKFHGKKNDKKEVEVHNYIIIIGKISLR